MPDKSQSLLSTCKFLYFMAENHGFQVETLHVFKAEKIRNDSQSWVYMTSTILENFTIFRVLVTGIGG